MIPGELMPAAGEIEINVGRATRTVTVANSGDLFPAFQLNADVTFERIEIEGQPITAIVTVIPTSLEYSETAALDRGKKRKEVSVSSRIPRLACT